MLKTTFAALSVLLSAQLINAQSTTATTSPVGFLTVTVPAAASASQPTNTMLGVPLYNPPDYVGAVTAVGTNTLTFAGAGWTAGAYSTVSAPRLVHVKVGTNAGKFFFINANTDVQLTVDLTATVSDLTTVVSVGDTCEVVPANTLGSLFGTSSVPFVTGSSVNSADTIWMLTGGQWSTYFHNGTSWRKSGNLANQNNTIIYPDDGVLITHIGQSPITLTLLGGVPTSNEQSDVSGATSTFVANRFPVDTTFATLSLQTLPGWVSGSSVNGTDNVYLWNASTGIWDIYFYNGSNWRKSGNLANQNTTVIPAGSSVVISRTNAAAVSLPQALPYTP